MVAIYVTKTVPRNKINLERSINTGLISINRCIFFEITLGIEQNIFYQNTKYLRFSKVFTGVYSSLIFTYMPNFVILSLWVMIEETMIDLLKLCSPVR